MPGVERALLVEEGILQGTVIVEEVIRAEHRWFGIGHPQDHPQVLRPHP